MSASMGMGLDLVCHLAKACSPRFAGKQSGALGLKRLLVTSTGHRQLRGNEEEKLGHGNTSSSTGSPESVAGSGGDAHEKDYEMSVRDRILSASLNHVPELGWSQAALEAGARTEGLPPVAHGMFKRGGAEIVHFFYRCCNSDLVDYMKQKQEDIEIRGLEKPKTTLFIQDSLQTRLKMILPYRDHWIQAMALQTLPQNAPESLTNLMSLMDDVWYYAGDRSVDFNWYTKRFTLAGVYKTTEIFMLQDQSPELEDTWTFMERRLTDVHNLGALKRSAENYSGSVKEGLKGLCIMTNNILGMNSRNR